MSLKSKLRIAAYLLTTTILTSCQTQTVRIFNPEPTNWNKSELTAQDLNHCFFYPTQVSGQNRSENGDIPYTYLRIEGDLEPVGGTVKGCPPKFVIEERLKQDTYWQRLPLIENTIRNKGIIYIEGNVVFEHTMNPPRIYALCHETLFPRGNGCRVRTGGMQYR